MPVSVMSTISSACALRAALYKSFNKHIVLQQKGGRQTTVEAVQPSGNIHVRGSVPTTMHG